MMRRTIVFLFAVLGLLIPVAPGTANAQVGGDPIVTMEATVTGQTLPGVGTPLSPTRRTSGPGQFDATQITALIVCRDNDPSTPDDDTVDEAVLVQLTQPAGAAVHFNSDDDLSDGYGEITATTPADHFTGTGLEVRLPAGVPADADVTVRINGGRFDRFGAIVRVDLSLDVRVERQDGEFACHDDYVPFRIEFLILPFAPQGGPIADDLLSGFLLVGVGRDHYTDPDPLPDRFPCDIIGHQSLPPNDVEHNRICPTTTA